MANERSGINRQTVDLSEFPDLVVIYLGMRVRNMKGMRKLIQTHVVFNGRADRSPARTR